MDEIIARSVPKTKRVVARSRAPKRLPLTLNPNGANSGGPCLGCGSSLEFWFNYQLCNRCLMPGIVTQRLS